VTPYTYILDDFLQQWSQLRAYADRAVFENITSPVDQVVYPHICAVIPDRFREEVEFQLQAVFGVKPIIKHLFMRMSPAGVPVPHEAHTDLVMGQWSLMLYMNREFNCKGGTDLVQHIGSGLDVHPRNDHEMEIWKRDHNIRAAWATNLSVKMVANRAFIFPAYLMHRAEPIGGFGRTQLDARMVLTAFFNL
jgi:hypothetical protein